MICPSISTSPQQPGMRPYPLTTYEQLGAKISITAWIGYRSHYVVKLPCDGNDENCLKEAVLLNRHFDLARPRSR